MSKHTPGPWVITSAANRMDGRCEYRIGPIQFSQHVFGKTFPELHANAMLIAAAPDLLAELQNIANADPSKWEPDVRGQFQQWAQSRARAAIAKAREEQP